MSKRKLPHGSRLKIGGIKHGTMSIDAAGLMTITHESGATQGTWLLKMCMDTGVIDKSQLENPYLTAGGVSYDQIWGTIDPGGGGKGALHEHGTGITAASADWDAGAPPEPA